MSPGYGRSSHSLLSITTMRLHDTSLTFTFLVLLYQGACYQIFLLHFYECFCILSEFLYVEHSFYPA